MLLVVFGLLAAALLPGNAAPTTNGVKGKAQRIPLSTVRLPEGVIGCHRAGFQQRTTGGNVGLAFDSNDYALIGSVSVGSPGMSIVGG